MCIIKVDKQLKKGLEMKFLIVAQFGFPIIVFFLGIMFGVVSVKKVAIWTFVILAMFVGVTVSEVLSPFSYFLFGISVFFFLPILVVLFSLTEKTRPSPVDYVVGGYQALSSEDKELAKKAGGKVLRGLLAVASGHFRKKGHTGLASAAEQFLK